MAAVALGCVTTSCDDTGTDCADGPIPVGTAPPAPEAVCAQPASANTLAIQSDFTATGLAQRQLRGEVLDPANINVFLCGTGSPVPSSRTQACTAVFVGGKFLLFDAGDGASRSIEALNLPLADIHAVFLTHFHSDHIAGVGEVISRSWILGRTTPLPVYGGQAIERVVGGFNRIYALDDEYRVAHHGEASFPIDVARAETHEILSPSAAGHVVYDQDGVVVRAYAVDHSPAEPALGYRVEYMGRVVGISGDTVATEGLENIAQGADVLVSEVINNAYIEETECAIDGLLVAGRVADIFRDIRTYHIDVADLARVAQDAGVQTLALTHLVPTPADPAQADELFTTPISAGFGGTVLAGEDGDRITVPVN